MKSVTTNSMHNQDPVQARDADALAVSALVDGELDDALARQLLRRLASGGPERGRFREYGLIGDTLRGLDHDMPGLTNRVMTALENEPTLLAPMRKPHRQRPALWLAAAAVAAITWGLWSAGPRLESPASLAANQNASPDMAANAPGNVMPYLAAHQDFAQAVVSPPEMRFTRVTLAGTSQ
jgi:sigma-E factor negative regulatory protein RseA